MAEISRSATITDLSVTVRWPCAKAASIARCATMLTIRGTPPATWWIRHSAGGENSSRACPWLATASRWWMYATVSELVSGPMCQRSVMRWLSCTSSGCCRSWRSWGWPTSTMRSSFSVVVSRFESRRSCSRVSIPTACASSMITTDRRPAARPASRCLLRPSVRRVLLVLRDGSPNSALMRCNSSRGDRAGLKMYAVETSSPIDCRKVRRIVVLPAPTSPVMQTKPLGSSSPRRRWANASACLREGKRNRGSGVSRNGASNRPKNRSYTPSAAVASARAGRQRVSLAWRVRGQSIGRANRSDDWLIPAAA
jgi:hypothetical protein